MVKPKLNYLFFFQVLLLNSIWVTGVSQNKLTHAIDSLEFKLQEWKKDSLGCEGLRDHYHFEFWENLHHYVEGDTILAKLLLGKSNETRYQRGQILYIYYFGTKCNEGVIDKRLPPNHFCVAYTDQNKFINIQVFNH